MDIMFNVDEQTISRENESTQPAEGSKNYLKCKFNFSSVDWTGLVKVAVFKNEQGKEFNKYLGRGAYGECFVPHGALKGDYFTVCVYGGDLITTNEVIVTLARTGYTRRCSAGEQDIFIDIFEEIDSKVDMTSHEDDMNTVAVQLDNKMNINDFQGCFDNRMIVWMQNITDGINQL